ncbi:MAG TPA: hypothetical protein VNI77_01025 [Nitrososphaera sp.]|nr:hypothetical protein [Nitrososphaera sp.]
MIFDKLNIKNMLKNRSLAQTITDAIWGKLRHYTAYKVEKGHSGPPIVIDPRGTSQNAPCAEWKQKKKSPAFPYVSLYVIAAEWSSLTVT